MHAGSKGRRLVALFLACLGIAGMVHTASIAQVPLPPGDPLPAPRPVSPPASPLPSPPVEEAAPPPREVADPTRLPPAAVGEEAAPMPREQTPSPPQLVLPSQARLASPLVEVARLHQEIEALRMEREAMLIEEMDLLTAKELKAGKIDGTSLLRRRITELLAKAAQARKVETNTPPAPDKTVSTTPTKPGEKPLAEGMPKTPITPKTPSNPTKTAQTSKPPESPKKPESHPLTDAPVDPVSLAQALFLSGDYASALKAYRQLEEEEQRTQQRLALQYMIACCLRKLGKFDEATTLYREVANSRGSDFLVESAQWYLRALKERRGLEGQLAELRQRRQTLMPRKP
jgi:TolA-binding protein